MEFNCEKKRGRHAGRQGRGKQGQAKDRNERAHTWRRPAAVLRPLAYFDTYQKPRQLTRVCYISYKSKIQRKRCTVPMQV